MRSDQERLLDILEAIERIERYASRGREAFDRDELIQTWIVHNLQIVGEAAARLSDDVRQRAPDVPWAEIVGMRNILIHEYFGIDASLVWSVVERDLPALNRHVQALLQEFDSG